MPQRIKVGEKDLPLSLPRDLGTEIAFKDIFISDVYGLETLSEPPDSVIDVGAHAGLFSIAIRNYFPRARIHAYEPNPALFTHLKSHSTCGHFTPFKEAVGGAEGRAILKHPGDSVFTQCVPLESGEIQVTSLSKVISRIVDNGEVDLLKLDCEGSEWGIFKDGVGIRRVKRITMEYHLTEQHSLNDLRTALKNLGFRIDFLHSDGPCNGRVRASKVGN
jgi:FkbM family methyltransferase